MGGQAFHELGDNAFPRLQPSLYQCLKEKLTPILRTLYRYVETPVEVPGKRDHGDLDFVVYEPLHGDINKTSVQTAIGAQLFLCDGHTSNFAIPMPDAPDGSHVGKFYQVDVHVCSDKGDWDRVVFFHSYGDLGMILGLLARAHGLVLGTHGLKIQPSVTDDTHPSSFQLSDSFPDILPFFRLSLDEWKRGFTTVEEVFKWIQTSRFFYPKLMNDTRKGKNKRMERPMYHSFLEFSHTLAESEAPDAHPRLDSEDVIQEALDYFSKREEYEAIGKANVTRTALKSKFSGSLVMAWTGVEGKAIKLIMDEIRSRLSTDTIIAMDTEELRTLVLEVQKNLNGPI